MTREEVAKLLRHLADEVEAGRCLVARIHFETTCYDNDTLATQVVMHPDPERREVKGREAVWMPITRCAVCEGVLRDDEEEMNDG